MEEQYRKKTEEAKRREEALENDLANMWVLVAKLKKDGGAVPESNIDKKNDGAEHINGPKTNDVESNIVPKEHLLDAPKPDEEMPKEEPLVVRLKVTLFCSYLYFSSS